MQQQAALLAIALYQSQLCGPLSLPCPSETFVTLVLQAQNAAPDLSQLPDPSELFGKAKGAADDVSGKAKGAADQASGSAKGAAEQAKGSASGAANKVGLQSGHCICVVVWAVLCCVPMYSCCQQDHACLQCTAQMSCTRPCYQG